MYIHDVVEKFEEKIKNCVWLFERAKIQRDVARQTQKLTTKIGRKIKTRCEDYRTMFNLLGEFFFLGRIRKLAAI